MVRSAARSAPSTGNPTSSSNPSQTAAAGSAAARGAPSNFATGQNFGSDPLAALNRANLAGPHMANLNPFASMGINQNDPNVSSVGSWKWRMRVRWVVGRRRISEK